MAPTSLRRTESSRRASAIRAGSAPDDGIGSARACSAAAAPQDGSAAVPERVDLPAPQPALHLGPGLSHRFRRGGDVAVMCAQRRDELVASVAIFLRQYFDWVTTERLLFRFGGR